MRARFVNPAQWFQYMGPDPLVRSTSLIHQGHMHWHVQHIKYMRADGLTHPTNSIHGGRFLGTFNKFNVYGPDYVAHSTSLMHKARFVDTFNKSHTCGPDEFHTWGQDLLVFLKSDARRAWFFNPLRRIQYMRARSVGAINMFNT